MKNLKLFGAIVLLFASTQLLAATFYVDYQTGSDSNTGTSTSTPWRHLPGVNGWSGSRTLATGDTICLKGGVVFPKRIYLSYLNGSTSAGGYTLKGDCANWGVGRASIDVPPTENASAAILIDGVSRVTVEGVFVANRQYFPNSWYAGVYVTGSILNPVYRFTLRAAEVAYSMEGLWLNDKSKSTGINGVLVEDVYAHHNSADASVPGANCSGVRITGGTNVTVRRLETYRNGQTCFSDGLNEGRGLTIEGGASTVLIEDSVLHEDSDPAGYEGSGIEGYTSNNVTIRRVWVWGGATAAEIKHAANNWTVYDSVFDGRSLGPFQFGSYLGVGSTGGRFFNNVFIGRDDHGCTHGVVSLTSPVHFQNNVVIGQPCIDRSPIVLNNSDGTWSLKSMDTIFHHNATISPATLFHVMTITPGPVYTNYTVASYTDKVSSKQLQGSQVLGDAGFKGGYYPTSVAGFSPDLGSAVRGVGTCYLNSGCVFPDWPGLSVMTNPNLGIFQGQ